MDKLIIIGAGGHGKVVADIALRMNKWKYIEFLDDREDLGSCIGFEIVGTIDNYYKFKNQAELFVAIGDNHRREEIQEKLISEGYSIATLIHPNSIIGIDVEIGIGTVIMGGAVINSSTKIGKGSIINTSSSIDHDNLIEDYVHISPGVKLGGTVLVGKRTWIGMGSTVINNIEVCSDCIIGAGGLVVKDISDKGVYKGIIT